MTARVRFDWEEAVAHDVTLQRIDAYVKLTISKLPGQPAPHATNTKGSRYEPLPPSVKAEQLSTATMDTPFKPESTPESIHPSGATPQYINIRDYLSESSSEVDTREVNPMDELSDFEPGSSHAQSINRDQSVDVEMVDEGAETACEVCKKSDREDEIILCDECNAEYHIFCLEPPLQKVPEDSWYCIKCCVQYAGTPVVHVKSEQRRITHDATKGIATTPSSVVFSPVTDTVSAIRNDPTSIPIAQALDSDPEKSNLLLIHACNCDDMKCTDPELHVFCPHMKRFLRSVCWASHSDKWRTYRLAKITAQLLAYHAMKCTIPQCNVPLCNKIREEEIV